MEEIAAEEEWDYASDASSLDLKNQNEEVSVEYKGCRAFPLPPSAVSQQYSALNTQANEIRLLEILPGSNEKHVNCLVATYTLQAAPAYIALSYAWGSPGSAHTINVNGNRTPVRQSLWDLFAEIAIQKHYQGLLFWIDALCINQADSNEKTHQVSLMASIYRRADLVLAWLGKRAEDSDFAMEAMRHHEQTNTDPAHAASGFWKERNERVMASLRKICSRQYWSRLWVLQELALASDANILCGPETLRWKTFDAILSHEEAQMDNSSNVGVHTPVHAAELPNENGAKAMQRNISLAHSQASLIELVIACQHLQCAEPRDKIYALLGIVGNKYDDIRPDYKICQQALFNCVLNVEYSVTHPISLREINQRRLHLIEALRIGECSHTKDEASSIGRGFHYNSRKAWLYSRMHHSMLDVHSMLACLQWAVENHLDTVIHLWKETCELQRASEIFCRAVEQGDIRGMRVLLEVGAVRMDDDVRVRDTGSAHAEANFESVFEAALRSAICGKKMDALQFLLDHPDMKTQRRSGVNKSVFRAAVPASDRDAATLLLNAGIQDINAKDFENITALHAAVRKGSKATVALLFDASGLDWGIKWNLGQRTALHLITENDHPNTVEMLLWTDVVDLNVRENDQMKPLHAAVMCSCHKMVTLFLEAKAANPNASDKDEKTPLHFVADSNQPTVVKLLIDSPKLLRKPQDSYGITPLHYAARGLYSEKGSSSDYAHVLLQEQTMNVNARTPKKSTPLHVAARSGNEGVPQLVLQPRMIFADARDEHGRTALRVAAETGHDAGVTLLFQHNGISINDEDKVGTNALHLATRHGHELVAKTISSAEERHCA